LSAALSPLVAFFLLGGIRYCTGEAVLVGSGLPMEEAYNIDPDLRCSWVSAGCLVSGNEWMQQDPNNAAVKMMIALFGPQPGSYTGPYPTRTDAAKALDSGEPLDLGQLAADRVVLKSQSVTLAAGKGPAMLRGTEFEYKLLYQASGKTFPTEEARSLDRFGPITGTLWRGQCLIVRVPTSESSALAPMPQSAVTVIIDAKTGKPFACYVEGEVPRSLTLGTIR
jgi:hypothetical protein